MDLAPGDDAVASEFRKQPVKKRRRFKHEIFAYFFFPNFFT